MITYLKNKHTFDQNKIGLSGWVKIFLERTLNL